MCIHLNLMIFTKIIRGFIRAPHHSLSLEDVVAFFSRKRVAKYKYPEHIVVIEKLPRTASGKIQKFLLRKDIMRRLTQDVCEEIE